MSKKVGLGRSVKIFSFVKNHASTMIASVRIARFVSERLGVPITVDDSVADGSLDALVIVNGAYAFCDVLEPLGQAIFAADKVVWIQNDYTIIPPKPTSDATSPFRKAFVDRRQRGKQDTIFWSTCHDWAALPGGRYVNWNCLTFDQSRTDEQIKASRKRATADLFYYGSWRAASGKSSRERYFDRYFKSPAVETVVSTPAKQFARYDKITVTDKITENFSATLSSHGMGLYIEDRLSHENFHSPANRFYEMLSAGLPILFQPECGAMMRRAGYDPTPYQPTNSIGIQRMMENREQVMLDQRAAWITKAESERVRLPLDLEVAFASLWKK